MVKQNASIDASFWINACNANIVEHLFQYFALFVPSVVAQEIRFPLEKLGIQAYTCILFNQCVNSGKIVIKDPQSAVNWFQAGENAAIGLAIEHEYFVLIDDANPYHRAKFFGLPTVGTIEFIVLLYDHIRLSQGAAIDAINRTSVSKPQKRNGLFLLEQLARQKGDVK